MIPEDEDFGEVYDEAAMDEGSGVELHPMAAAADGNVENLTGPVPGYLEDPPVKAAVRNIMEAGKAILPAEEWSAVENGAELEFWIDVQPAEPEITEEDLSLADDFMYNISDKVEGLCGGRYLNVKLYYQVDKGGWQEAVETDTPIAVDFAVPQSMQGVSEHFYGLCLHDGEAELLSDTSESKDVITVMTRWFDNTYALLYQDPDAAISSEVFIPETISDADYYDDWEDDEPDFEKIGKTRSKTLAMSWLVSGGITMLAYAGYAALAHKDAIMVMIQTLPLRR